MNVGLSSTFFPHPRTKHFTQVLWNSFIECISDDAGRSEGQSLKSSERAIAALVMEVNTDTGSSAAPGHPVRPSVISRTNSERLKDEEIDQELLQSKQHLSPGRAARMALQAISRKLGRADPANSSVETATALPTPPQAERRARERSCEGGGGRREEQRHRPWDGKGAVDPPRRTGSPTRRTTSISAGSRAPDTTPASEPPPPSPPPAGAAGEGAGAVRPSRNSLGDARPVQPSAAPRGLGGPTPRVRRRARAGNVSGLSIQPHSGATTAAADRYRPNQGRLETQHQQRVQLVAPSTQTQAVAAAGSPDFAAARKNIRGRSASARYLLLSVVLVVVGLFLRYFWRHLAGLAGAMFILAAARRWTGVAGRAGRVYLTPPLQKIGRVAGKRKGQRDATGAGSSTGRDSSGDLTASVTADPAGTASAEAVAGEGWRAEAFGGRPPGLPRYWEDGGPECRFNVRGPNYMSDRNKVSCVHVHVHTYTSVWVQSSSDTQHLLVLVYARTRKYSDSSIQYLVPWYVLIVT